MTDLGTLGGRWSTAWDINDLGQVVGGSDTPTGSCALPDGIVQTDYHAVLWEGGVIRDLQPNDCSPTIAYGINNSGHVVGGIDSCNFDGLGGYCGPVSAFLYSNGVMTDLNDLVPGLGLWTASGINDLGQIVANGNDGAYRLDPAPLCSLRIRSSRSEGARAGTADGCRQGCCPRQLPHRLPPPAPPPSGPGSCATPDPFVSLGGGTCYNGGWLPPGMSPPSSRSSARASTRAGAAAGTFRARVVRDARSVRLARRRDLFQRWLAAARHGATAAAADNADGRRMFDTRSVRRTSRAGRAVRQRWLDTGRPRAGLTRTCYRSCSTLADPATR